MLITGVSGFIGAHCALEFLSAGYQVRGTMRDLGRAESIRTMLAQHDERASDMEFAAATLTDADGWTDAVRGCDAVIHVASPVPVEQPSDPDEVIVPARDGALNVLAAARNAGIRRVVLTSSVAAATGVRRAAAIMRDDHYGWFERVARGIYAVTPNGAKGLKAHADMVAALTQREK